MLSPKISHEDFRRKLAGLEDPEKQPTGIGIEMDIQEMSNRFIWILCRTFGLKRKKLWERIPTALQTSSAKCDDGNLDRFTSMCLAHVKAEPARVARCEEYHRWLSTAILRPDSWKQAFIRYFSTTLYAAVVHGRNAWEDWKKLNTVTDEQLEEELELGIEEEEKPSHQTNLFAESKEPANV